MHLGLLIIGVMVTLAGAAMIGYGIPINGFDVGNMLIMAGTTAFVGGLIVIALAEAVKQLRRIAGSARSVALAPRTGDHFAGEPAPAPRTGRVPFPPKPEKRDRARMASEPRLGAAPSIDTDKDHTDLSEPDFAGNAPEPRVLPEHDETPLSPLAEPRFAAARDNDDELSKDLLATAFSRLDVSLRHQPPANETQKQNEPFESVWPAETRKTSGTAPQSVEEAPAPAHEEPVEEPDGEKEQPEAPYAVSILKSGVIDGMAYTLYSDGSIEAEMPQGTMRFVSVTELRAYLEKSSS